MKNYLDRRNFIKYTSITVPFISTLCLAACSDDDATKATDAGVDLDPKEMDGGTEDGGGTQDGGDGTEDVGTDSGATFDGWASGGTDLITKDFPADSIFAAAGACAVSLTGATTEGPCYFEDSTGEDISLGLSGLPMQLCLRLEDSSCQPLAGYTVEVWHCDVEGIYSGDTSESANANSFAGDFCTGGEAPAQASTWYRGQLTTDASGRVNFKSCFPGWYRGRTIHIHFAVSDGTGNSRVISQFCFPDSFAKEICTTHELYESRGEQDTTLAGGRDSVFPSSGIEPFLLTTKKNSDGTLLAFQTIQIT